MIIFLITDQNFKQQKSQREITSAGVVTELRKTQNAVTITINIMAPFAIYKWEHDGHFAISNRLDEIANYIGPLGFELSFTSIESKYMGKPFVDYARNCSNVEKITQWSKVVINRNGSLRITPPKKQPYTIDLISKRGVKNLLAWLKKYLIIIKQEIENNNFLPTLTGGLDTRTLTWFWRDWYCGSNYYLKAVKSDGKNAVAKGQAEIELATQVLQRIGKPMSRVEKLGGGGYGEHSLGCLLKMVVV